MTLYDCYKITNLEDFEYTALVSRKFSLILGELGTKEVLVIKGNKVSILFEGIFLSLDLNSKNPFEFEDHAVFVDPNNDIWLGIKSES